MWRIADIVRSAGVGVEFVVSSEVGRIIFRDNHQVAAIPHRGVERNRVLRLLR